jgi:hypothetical protein
MEMNAELSKIVKVIEELEGRLATLRKLVDPEGLAPPSSASKRGRKKRVRDPDAPKREPNAWIKFTQRVRAVLKENGEEIKMAKHFMKFKKAVQEEDGGVDFTDEQILEMRRGWEPPAEDEAPAPAPTTETPSAEKKRGRKPMTEEQKAAARASRETLRESSASSATTVPDIEDVPMAAGTPAKKKIAAKKPSFK